jgi:hypothetical protein
VLIVPHNLSRGDPLLILTRTSTGSSGLAHQTFVSQTVCDLFGHIEARQPRGLVYTSSIAGSPDPVAQAAAAAACGFSLACGRAGADWTFEIGNWKLEIRNWKLETGNSKLAKKRAAHLAGRVSIFESRFSTRAGGEHQPDAAAQSQ